MMKRLLILLLAAAAAFACDKDNGGGKTDPDNGGGQTPGTPDNLTSLTVYGKVLDENGVPYPGVVMTDGYNFAQTDADGFYRFEKYRYASFVQCSVPADAAISTGGTYNLPDSHYKRLTSATKEYNFTLKRQEPGKRFRILALGDPQVHSASQVNRYRQTALSDIRQYVVNSEKIPTYGITLGDNVGDAWELFPDIATVFGEMTIPVFTTIGNHDHEFPNDTDAASRKKYEAVFGPSNFSFNRGDVHIVVFDNVLHSPECFSTDYVQGYEPWQLEWLKKDLSYVPKDKAIFMTVHIPLTDSAILDVISQRNSVIVACGHTHKLENTYDKTVNGTDITICAAGSTGAPWKGLILSDGCQRGYKVYEYDGAKLSREIYKSIQYEEPFQMRMFRTTDFPAFTTEGGLTYAFQYFGGSWIAVNLFNYKPGWKVVLKENGVLTSSAPIQANSYDVWAKMFMYNYHDRDTDSGKTRHMLYFQVKDPKASISVEATDEFGATFTCDQFTTTANVPDYDN
ncbi:MAG: calcineurin-like phosphoesterase C-terminal domain-containing protein [Bacteroidales bacterium]|nr:calcineurin-like phosphoesterase C-terminal domain-containing protein [Bacteroidales bacterium]